MRVFLVVVLALVASVAQADCSGAQTIVTQASCGGAQAASCGGAQAIIKARPVRQRVGILARIRALPKAACSGSAASLGCSGSRSVGCAGSASLVIPAAIVVPASIVVPVASLGSGASIAQQSADYRAANGIKGHTHFESGHMAGVGYSSFNSNPATCFNNMGGDYKVARGRDGFYATRIVR